MEGHDHIPPDEFASALERLDRGELAAFVGAVWAATAEDVTVDPPIVTVRTDSETVRLLAATDDPGESLERVDAVVTAREGLVPDHPTVGPSALRNRLLYGLAPDEADTLCERHLGRPARSPEYRPADRAATSGASDGRSANTPAAASGDDRRRAQSGRIDGLLVGTPLEPLSERVGRQVAMVSVLAVVVAVTGVMAVFVGGFVPGEAGDPAVDGGEAGAGDTPTPDGGAASTATPAVDAETATPTPEDEDEDEDAVRSLSSDRYADMEPTCERSFLHVVQIQMNALKYNDNTTNDGIRTVRRFASPRNREAVGSLQRFVRIINRGAYAPMLSYDSAEYTPWRFSEDTAQVRVVTRENGTVTGRYAFRLRKQNGGEYDGCWMTEGVQSLSDSAGSDVE